MGRTGRSSVSEFREKTKRSGPSRARPSHGAWTQVCGPTASSPLCVWRDRGGRACSVSPGGLRPPGSPKSPYSEICHVFALYIPLSLSFLFEQQIFVLCTMGHEQLVSSAKPPWAAPGAPRCPGCLVLLAQAAWVATACLRTRFLHRTVGTPVASASSPGRCSRRPTASQHTSTELN